VLRRARARGTQDPPPSLEDASNAWWTDRDELTAAPTYSAAPRGGRLAQAQAQAQQRGPVGFEEYFPTSDLFEPTGATETPPEPCFDSDDPFLVLGLANTVGWPTVTVTYKALVKRWHPDRPEVDDDLPMRRITWAYGVLKSAYRSAGHDVS
jgi:hypothetical protein